MRVAYLKVNQTGATLILMAFIIALAATVYLLKAYDPAQLRLEQDKKTYLALNEAKQALIAWSVAHPNWPGVMPFPDRKESSTPNYDGKSDCVTTGLNVSHLLGKLPSQGDIPCIDPQQGLPADLYDGTGERLWYAVSRNLVRTNGSAATPIVNPSIINNPLYQWLRVVDRNGVLISDRVAAVIIAPGNVIGSQSRPSPPATPANPNMFLDAFTINGTQYSNADYDTENEDFVIGQDSRQVSDADTSVDKPYYFNDKLVYITIDELMAAIEKRVGEEVRVNLKAYATANAGNYPFAAELGGTGPLASRKYHCISDNLTGALPVDDPADICTYEATEDAVKTSCSFQSVSSIEFSGALNSFNQDSGACTQTSTNICTCTGAGSCSHDINLNTFTCDAIGNCNGVNIVGIQKVRFLGTSFDKSSSFCTLGPMVCPQPSSYRVATCNNSATSAIPKVTLGHSCTDFISTLPTWFKANRWQDYVFYEMTRPADSTLISVGIKKAAAVIVTTGASIDSQLRPSCDLGDYLELANTGQNHIYEPTYKRRASNYNDQTFVVAP